MAQPLDFYLVTDIHYYAASLGVTGPAYERASGGEQKCLGETGAIVDAAFEKMAADQTIHTVLIAGDLSRDGEKASHLEFEKKLRKLKQAGKAVYVITATHDCFKPPKGYQGDKEVAVEGVDREELPALYRPYGLVGALAYHASSHSYTARLQEGYRLLALNDDGNGADFCGYSKEQLAWIMEQIEAAKKAGEYMLVMTHHPMLPPSPIYPFFCPKEMLGNWQEVSALLADAGIEFVFTGHTHMQNINSKTTEKGNTIYDINTASLVGYPSPIRRIHLTDSAMEITTEHIEDFHWDKGGKTAEAYLQAHFDFMLEDIIHSMAYDLERFKELATGFSMTGETVEKLKIPLCLAGRILQKLTVGGLSALFFTRKTAAKEVRPILIKDLLIEFVRNIYGGDEPYSRETPVGKAFLGIIDRVSPLVKKIGKGSPVTENLSALMESVIYDSGLPDNNAVLPRKKLKEFL